MKYAIARGGEIFPCRVVGRQGGQVVVAVSRRPLSSAAAAIAVRVGRPTSSPVRPLMTANPLDRKEVQEIRRDQQFAEALASEYPAGSASRALYEGKAWGLASTARLYGAKPNPCGRGRGRRRRNPVLSSEDLARQAGLAELAQAGARRFRDVARAGVLGTERSIERQAREADRQARQVDRQAVRDLKDRGGIRRPEGVSREEWRSSIPRALHHRPKKGAGVPLDELAQELADRGMIRDAYGDSALDFVRRAWDATQAKAVAPDPRELRRQARQHVDRGSREIARDLVSAAREQAMIVCRANPVRGRHARDLKSAPAAKIAEKFHGEVRRVVRLPYPKLPKKAYEVGKLEAVIYRPPTWSKIGPVPRIHYFDRPRPRLLGFTSGPPWLIEGGSARFTSRGFVG